MKFKYALTIVCLFAIFTLTSAYAQDVWNGGTGNWSNAANWSTGIVPNGSTIDVRIDGGNPINSVVTFDLSNGSVGTLLLDADDALNIDGALTSYFATLTSGTLTIDPGGSLNNNGLLNNYNVLNNYYGGTINNNSGGTLNNYGDVNCCGTLNNSSGGIVNNHGYLDSFVLNNYGQLYNGGTEYNSGTLDNHGTLNNSGMLSGVGTLNNYGTLYNTAFLISCCGPLNNYSDLENYGSVLGGLNNFATFNNYGFLGVGQVLNNYADLENYAGVQIYDTLNNYGTLKNFGSFDVSSQGELINFSLLENYSAFSSEDYVENHGTLSNDSGGTLNNNYGFVNYGMLNNTGTLNNNADGTLSNYGTLNNLPNGMLDNWPGGTIDNGPGGTLSNYSVITNSGTIRNAGIIVITPGGSLTNVNFGYGYLGTYTQSGGSTVVDGLFSSVTPIQINGGTLSGSGVIQGDVFMGGTMSPGDSPGVLTIQGNYTQLSGGTFFAELAGLTPGTQYDQLLVSGTAALDGTLDVALLNGFVVQLGDSFVLMTFGSETGQFSVLDLPTLTGGEMWRLSYNATDLTLSVVPTPEPASFLLLGSGLLGALSAFRRKINL